MAVEGTQFEMLCDQSLTDAARIIGLRIAALGDDWHELRPDDFAKMVSGYPKQDTIAKHLRQLEIAGYVERKPGGRGHSDKFRFAFSSEEISPPKPDVIPFRSGVFSLGPENTSELKASTVSKEDSKSVSELVPTILSPAAEAAIEQHSELLKGCRDSLRDYLAARVPVASQAAYVQSLACSFQDMPPTFRKPDGTSVPMPERGGVAAAALNELLQSGERTVRPPMKPMKWPDGDIRNLRTKIEIHLKQGEQNGRRNDGNRSGAGASAGRGSRPDKYAHLEGADTRPGA